MEELRITYESTDALTPYANNPRFNDAAVDAVAASIEKFGFKVPIIITEEKEIVAGHTRLKAAKQLGLDKVPCIIADDLTDAQIKAFRLADNKVSEFADWDFEALEIELDKLKTLNLDFELSDFGFENIDLESIENEDINAEKKTIHLDIETVIAISCENEKELESTFDLLTSEGYNCRILTL